MFTNVASLGGSTYIETANDDKYSTVSSFLTFDVNQDCTVYYNLPLYNWGSSTIIDGGGTFPDTCTPAPANLRFQLYTALAYGLRGVQWFTYFDELNEGVAPIVNGSKTSVWTYLQDVNNQMHRIGETYITLNTSNCNTFHHPTVPSGTTAVPFNSVGIGYSWYISNITGGSYVVGEFYSGSTPYLMVVNKSLTSNAYPSITLKSAYQGKTIKYVNPSTGALQNFSQGQTLLPGAGALLKLE